MPSAITRRSFAATVGAGLVSRPVRAAEGVMIGAILPLTGSSAIVGQGNRDALDITAEMINLAHGPYPVLLGEGGGLNRLGGMPLRMVFADHGGDPARAAVEAERLVNEGAVALIGTYQSATAVTVSDVAERRQIPFVSADNSAPGLHRRGLQWFFRTTPHDDMFTALMFQFLAETGAKTGRPVRSVALFYEDSLFGAGSSAAQRAAAQQAGLPILADIKYKANAASLQAEAEALRDADADVLMPSSYTADAILLMKTLAAVGYRPRLVVAQAAGFQEQAFLSAAGPLAEGVISRSAFASDAYRFRSGLLLVNEFYAARAGRNLNDNSARQVVALQVLADAINRAGSTAPLAIRAALRTTDVPGDQTIMPWDGVRFDATGQNTAATPVLQQVSEGKYRTIYPASLAIRKVAWAG